MAEQCRECGASGRWGSCDELFMSLLAFDHERRQPWGRWHALNVAGYLLQHPSRADEPTLAGQWAMVEAFLTGGLEAVSERARRAVRQNGHRRHPPELEVDALPVVVAEPDMTIEDVSVDGSFPAQGYEARMDTWMRSIAVSRGAVA